VREYVVERLGDPGAVLIVDGTGFLKKGTGRPGCNDSIPALRTERTTVSGAAGPASMTRSVSRRRW